MSERQAQKDEIQRLKAEEEEEESRIRFCFKC